LDRTEDYTSGNKIGSNHGHERKHGYFTKNTCAGVRLQVPELDKVNRTDLTNTDTKQDRMREECTVFESTA
jgi:hypothetical protein